MLNNLASNNIRAELARRNISASQAAGVLGISKQAFSNRMTNKKPFNIEELEKLANHMNCHIFELLKSPEESTLAA